MNWPFIAVLLASYRNTKFSVAMLVCSLVIATAGLSAVLVINNSAKQSYSSDDQFLIADVSHQVIANGNDKTLSISDYANLRRAGFTELIAVAQTSQHLYVKGQRLTMRRIEHTGIDMFALFNLQSRPVSLSLSPSNYAKPITALTNNAGLLHPELLENITEAAAKLNEIPATISTESGQLLPELQAFESASLGNDILMSMANLYRLYPQTQLSSLLLVGDLSTERIELLNTELPEHLALQPISNAESDAELTSSFHLNLMAMALLMFVVCLFIVVNAINLLLHARMPWLKICRQLGIGRKELYVVQLVEVSLLTFLATIGGIIIGLELAQLASPTVQATLENLYQVEVGYGELSLLGLFSEVFAISLLGCVAATLLPLQKLNQNLSSTKAINEKISDTLWLKVTWGCFAVFALCGFVLLNFAQALWLLLVATACVILAGCCILLIHYPIVLQQIVKIIPSRFPLLQVSTMQSIALSSKTKIACCAFFIAATSNIGMNLMVDSFRGATVSWLEQRLAADYYIYSDKALNLESIAKEADVKVDQRFENYTVFNKREIEQFSYPTSPRFRAAMSFYKVAPNLTNNQEGLWEEFESEQGILINQQFAFSLNYDVDDIINIPHPSTDELNRYRILGIIYDFGNPSPQVLMPAKLFNPATTKYFIYSVSGTPASIEQFQEALVAANIDIDKRMIETSELLRISMRAFDNTFVITDGLNLVTLLVAALSLACAIVVIMSDLRPQNMLVRSLGVSAFKTQALALFQYILLCVVALLFATPFGILLGWVLISDINYQAFSWTYPLLISAIKIAKVYGVSLVVVVVIIAIPLIRAGKRPLINDIRQVN
jgi:putative ABC transport system permease protein